MVDRVKIMSTVIPVTVLQDILEIIVKQVNCCFAAGFTASVSVFTELVDI